MSRIEGLCLEAIKRLGKDAVKKDSRVTHLYGWARFEPDSIINHGLEVVFDNCPDRHVTIQGWIRPEGKKEDWSRDEKEQWAARQLDLIDHELCLLPEPEPLCRDTTT